MPNRIVRVRGKRGNLVKKLKLDKVWIQDERAAVVESRLLENTHRLGPSFEDLPNELLWQIWLDSNNPSLLHVSSSLAQRLTPVRLQFVQSLTTLDASQLPDFDYAQALDQTFAAAFFSPEMFFQIRVRELMRQGLKWIEARCRDEHSLSAEERRALVSSMRAGAQRWSHQSTFLDNEVTTKLVSRDASQLAGRDLEFMSAWRPKNIGRIFARVIEDNQGSFLNTEEIDVTSIASLAWPPLSAIPRRALRKYLQLPYTQQVGDILNLLVPPKIHDLWSEDTDTAKSALTVAIRRNCSTAVAVLLNVQHFDTAWLSFYDEFDESALEEANEGIIPVPFRPQPRRSVDLGDEWSNFSWPYIPDEKIHCKLDQATISACCELALSKEKDSLWIIGTVFDSALNWTSAASAHAELAANKTKYLKSWIQCAELVMDWLLNRGSAKGPVPMARQIAVEQVFDSSSDFYGKLTSREFRSRHMRSIEESADSFDFLQYFLAFWKQAFALKVRLTEVQHRTLFLGKQWHHPPNAYQQLERFV